MVDRELLGLLVCPETKQPVRLADADTLESLNEAIGAGRVSTRGGQRVDQRVDAGLLREDGRYLYPVRDEIPIMLIDEAIPMGTSHTTSP